MSAPVGGPQVNKFEQFSSLEHQMLLVTGVPGLGGWDLYSRSTVNSVQTTVKINEDMGNGHMDPTVDRITDRHN